MGRESITSGGENKHPFFHCCQRERRNNKTQLIGKGFYFVGINSKGG